MESETKGNVLDVGSAVGDQRVENVSSFYAYMISIVAALGGLLFGYDVSIISGALPIMNKLWYLNADQQGFVVSSAIIGCIVAAIAGGKLSDAFGRRKSLVFTAVLFGASALGTAAAKDLAVFAVFRIIGGFGIGLASLVSPMYISEVAPARIRGRLVIMNQVAVVLGMLAAMLMSYWLSKSLPDMMSWRWMFASAGLPVVALVIGLLFVPESPRWLTEKGRSDEALNVMSRVDGRAHAKAEMAAIVASMNEESGIYAEILQPGMRRALVIACMLAVFQQIAGVSTLILYSPTIFARAGSLKVTDAIWQGVLVNSCLFLVTIVALWLVDKVGRRPLLLIGIGGMALGQVLMGVFFWNNVGGIYVLLVMFMCVATYSISLAPLAWLIMSEIFPNRIRGKAMAIASMILWATCFAVNQIFPYMCAFLKSIFGRQGVEFWIFGLFCVAAFLFSWIMVPETKGRTLEEIGRCWTAGQKTGNRSR